MSGKVTKKTIVTEDGEIRDVVDYETTWSKGPEWKTPHNHDTLAEATRTGTAFLDPTRTQQNTRDETDINNILRKFGVDNVRAHLAQMPPSFVDVPEHLDMAEAIKLVRDGEESFLKLHADVRAKFDNDLARYVGYVDDRLKANDLEALDGIGLDVKDALERQRAAKRDQQQKEDAAFAERVTRTAPKKTDKE